LPAKAKRLTAHRVEVILKKHRVRRVTATDVRDLLQRDCLQVLPDSVTAIGEHVGILIPLIEAFDAQYRHVFKTLKAVVHQATEAPGLQEERTVALMTTLPGIGVVVSTALLGEAAAVLADCNERAFRCYAGVAPITKQSGKSRRVSMRYGCNERIREPCYHWARTSVQRDANSRLHYSRLRQSGHSHGRALRGVWTS
jgi:transposase